MCANVELPSPRRLVVEAVAAASGIAPEDDRWLPERAVWPLLEVVDAALGEPWLAPLAAHLGEGADDPRRGRRFGVVRHVAGLLDRYALLRPELLRAWDRGEDVDAAGRALGADAAWQAELWRRLRDRIGQPGPAQRVEAACARLREDPAVVALPPRLALFGLTRLPAGHLDVLAALAAHRDVHLLLLHPSPALWARVAEAGAPVRRRRADPTAALPRNRLLASWGQDARELQLVVAGAPGGHVDHHHAVAHGGGTLLARLQADVHADRRPPGPPLPGAVDERPLLDPADRSVQVHACHGRARQVEVVRDAVLHVLEEDPSLEPRDVIVMCPDIETFAPLVQATFGAGEVAGDDEDDDDDEVLPAGVRPPDLRVRLADRSLRRTNPVLGVVAELLDLAEGRLTASQVLGLADREPVRRRFGLGDDDLARLQDWVAEAGVRWGLDGPHRAAFGLADVEAGTWRAGLDRILLGVAMSEEGRRLVGDVLPLDDVGGDAIELAGRAAELVDRLGEALGALRVAQPLGDWARALAAAADALTATAPRDAWQRAGLQRVLDEVVEEADAAGGAGATRLALPEVRALLADRLAGRPTRAGFRTGHLTVCTLVPMRSVPHRVVCLLGLDDGAFPRRSPRDGDDLVLAEPHVGDRDARAEDRQLLLDALLAATDRLVITFAGNDERTNAPRPPAVPVGELLDAVDRTVRCEDGRAARAQVLVRHPLQPFDPRCYVPGQLVPGRPWGFDRATLDGARALAGPRRAPGPFLAAPLPPADGRLVALEDLVRFVEHPVRAFLRQRLGVSVRRPEDEVDDALPVQLDGLARWGIGQRVLEACLAGVELDDAGIAEYGRGLLPPGVLGEAEVQGVWPVVSAIAAAARAAVPDGAPAGSVDVRVDLPGGRLLRGTVPGVAGGVLRSAQYSRLAPKHRLAAWVRLLALTAARPEREWRAVTVGRGQDGARIARVGPLEAGEARAHLGVLLDLHARGLREPLPLACATSAAYAGADDPFEAAKAAWTSVWSRPGEDADPEHERVFGGVITFEALLAARPAPGEDWHPEEPSRFGRLARRLWSGLREHERLEDA